MYITINIDPVIRDDNPISGLPKAEIKSLTIFIPTTECIKAKANGKVYKRLNKYCLIYHFIIFTNSF